MRRRQFIQLGGLALAAPLVGPRLAFSADGPRGGDVLVCIFQRGGADGLNIVVPHAENRYYDLRPSIAIPGPDAEGGVIDLDGFFGLHPALGALQPLYASGQLAVIHAAGSPDESRSHFDAQDFMESGYLGKGVVFDGWVNRHLQLLGDSEATFRAVGIGQAVPLSLQGEAPVIGLDNVAAFDLRVPEGHKAALRKTLTRLHGGSSAIDAEASRVFEAVDTLSGVASGIEPAEGANYPAGSFGQQLAGLAGLVKADIGLEVACVDIGGWDHHDQESAQLPGLLTQLGEGLAAFHADVAATEARVTVVTMTEFGRRVEENASAGTDHGHGSVMLALGDAVNGGQVHGPWPGLGPGDLNRGDLEVTTDFRSVLAEALIQRRGELDPGYVFPDFDGDLAPGVFRAV